MGEGLVISTDPHHTPTFIQPSPQPQKTQKPKRPKKKDTQVPQSSVPSDNVTDKAVYKELDDSLVRATTIASSLEAEQDSGNIIKTRSKATPNELVPKELLWAVVPGAKKSWGILLLKLGLRMYLNFPMIHCSQETKKTTQANEITSLKTRVKKLEKKDRSRTHKLKRLYKVSLSDRVESSRDEEDLGEDASKQGRRIHDIDVDEDITLVNDDNEIFDVDTLVGGEVFVTEQSGNVVEEVVVVIDDASTIPVSVATIIDVEITLAQALAELKSAKPKADKPVVEQVKPMKRLEQMRLYEELAFKLQAEEEEERLAREKTQQIKEANIAWDDSRREEEQTTKKSSTKEYDVYLSKNMEGWKPKSLKNKSFANIQELFEKAMKRVNIFVDYRTELVEESSKKADLELEENLKKAKAKVMKGSSKRAGTELEQDVTKKQKMDDV
ncbi:hypothetical protein Tco_0495792 [Tanacetum coccineum]